MSDEHFTLDEEGSDGLLHDLMASGSSRFFVALFFVSLFALIALCVMVSGDWASNNTSLHEKTPLSQGAPEDLLDDAANRVNTAQLPDSSFIYDVSIEELANADSYIDGQTVQVTGEVVGDRIIAEDDSDYCWITLQSTDKSDAELSVYMPLSAAASIDMYGAYGRRGTQLQVRGTFNLACVDHQGTSEVHSEHVAVVSKGKSEQIPFDAGGLIFGVVLVLIGSVSMLVYNVLRERQR